MSHKIFVSPLQRVINNKPSLKVVGSISKEELEKLSKIKPVERFVESTRAGIRGMHMRHKPTMDMTIQDHVVWKNYELAASKEQALAWVKDGLRTDVTEKDLRTEFKTLSDMHDETGALTPEAKKGIETHFKMYRVPKTTSAYEFAHRNGSGWMF